MISVFFKSSVLYAKFRLCCISGTRTSGSFEPFGSRLGRSSDSAEQKRRKKERKQEKQEEKEENLAVLRCNGSLGRRSWLNVTP